MVSPSGPTSFVSGRFVLGAVPHQPSAAAGPTTRPLLRRVLCEVCPGASDCHDAGAWSGALFHAQKEKVVETAGTCCYCFSHLRGPVSCTHFNLLHGYRCGSWL